MSSNHLAEVFAAPHAEVVRVIDDFITEFPEVMSGTVPERATRKGRGYEINLPMMVQVVLRLETDEAVKWADEYAMTVCNLIVLKNEVKHD